ncbi:4177_t:CDS:2, partial [Gigaspora margarita]
MQEFRQLAINKIVKIMIMNLHLPEDKSNVNSEEEIFDNNLESEISTTLRGNCRGRDSSNSRDNHSNRDNCGNHDSHSGHGGRGSHGTGG